MPKKKRTRVYSTAEETTDQVKAETLIEAAGESRLHEKILKTIQIYKKAGTQAKGLNIGIKQNTELSPEQLKQYGIPVKIIVDKPSLIQFTFKCRRRNQPQRNQIKRK